MPDPTEYSNQVVKDEPLQINPFTGADNQPSGQTILDPNIVSRNTNQQASGNTQYAYQTVTLYPGDDIQAALNNMPNGGTIILTPGTYIQNTPLIGNSRVTIQGSHQSAITINFNSTSANLSFSGSNVYTTGTISSISFGVNVVGSGTTWTSAMIGQQIFINNRWYVIANVTDATHLVLATGYADGATFSGGYRIATVIRDVSIMGVTFQASTGTAFAMTDCRDVIMTDCQFISNNKGYVFTNFMNLNPDRVTVAASTSNGVELTNGSFYNAYNCPSVSNGGSGYVLNNTKDMAFVLCAGDSNTVDGFNCTSVTNSPFQVEAASNGGIGIQFVSGCNGNSIMGGSLINNNTSDGIKLTASSSNNNIGSDIQITGNGGWGINIAAGTCNNNTIIVPYFSGNTSGTLQDLGTGTNQVLTGAPAATIGAFGGDGSDGALAITAGTTTLDLGAADVFVKNYSSISITGTGKLAFTNPGANGTIIILKSQGNVTLTSSTIPNIDASGMGGPGGTAGGRGANGFAGTSGLGVFTPVASPGNGGTGAGAVTATGGLVMTNTNIYTLVAHQLTKKYVWLFCGNGGGGGGGAQAIGTGGAGGNGGAGGGALMIECKGSLNFTSALGVSVAGANGSVGVANGGGGGGGGGSSGNCVILYNSLTAATGTINTQGGAGGQGASENGGVNVGGSGGSGAGSVYGAGGNGGQAGTNPSAPTVGVAGAAGTGGGGGGGHWNGTGAVGGAAGANTNVLTLQNKYFS